MLGWEFPPYFAGGVGIVCAQLCKALANLGVEVTYCMPSGPQAVNEVEGAGGEGFRLIIANNTVPDDKISLLPVDSLLHAYATPASYNALLERSLAMNRFDGGSKPLYGEDLWAEVHRFAEKVRIIAAHLAETEGFDVIHAHDHWTFPAGVAAKYATGKPLVVHVHITEFDKSGGAGVDQRVYDMERYGMEHADVVIAVSDFVKQRLITSYGVPAEKIRVVHNAAVPLQEGKVHDIKVKQGDKVVLFAGRVTLQKGPEYFVEAARIVAERDPNVKFVLAGSGDQLGRMIDRVAELGLSQRFFFTGFYDRNQAEVLFSMADVFVMPSVSEPFGVVPLEAMVKGTPCIISKQSGVSEVLHHCIKVDFWDVQSLAEHILSLLHYQALHHELKQHGYLEVKRLTWDVPAGKCLQVYQEVVGKEGVAW